MARYTITITKTQQESFTLEAESQKEASRLATELFERDNRLFNWIDDTMNDCYDPYWDVAARPYKEDEDSWLTPAEEIEGLLD